VKNVDDDDDDDESIAWSMYNIKSLLMLAFPNLKLTSLMLSRSRASTPNIRTGTFYPPIFDAFPFRVANISHKAICRHSLNCSPGSVTFMCGPFVVLATFCGVKHRPKPRVCHDTLSCVGRKENSVPIV
jgi:hypothetical protein